VSYPVRSLPLGHLEAILAGGGEKAAEAGVSILGGHSVDDPTPQHGLAVTGLVDPARVGRKSGARPGDRLILTKPLGIGVLTTAIDHGLVGAEAEARVLPVMAELNRAAAEAIVGAHACTDVTGFGLLGRLREMAQQSGVAARVSLRRVPVLEGAPELLREGAVSLGTQNNYRHLRDRVAWGEGVSREERLLLCDAQTSGGLLIAASPDAAEPLLAALVAAGCRAAEIGEATQGPAGRVAVEA
jgi:selenide,water dikinase